MLAASASTSVLIGDAGSPGVSLPQGRLATQKASSTHSCKLVIQDVLMYLFCTDLHSWSDQLDLTYANLRGKEEF